MNSLQSSWVVFYLARESRDGLCFLNIDSGDRLILALGSPAFISTSLLHLMRRPQPLSPPCANTKLGSIKHKSRANTKKNLITRIAIIVVNGPASV